MRHAIRAGTLPAGVWHVDDANLRHLPHARLRHATHAASGEAFDVLVLSDGRIVAFSAATADGLRLIDWGDVAGWPDRQQWRMTAATATEGG